MEEIKVQTCLNSYMTELNLANVVAQGSYILELPNPLGLGSHRAIQSTLTQDSIAPAIIFKRHQLLEYWYNTSAIYDAAPVPNNQGTLVPVPMIDQFRGRITRALLASVGRHTQIEIEGTWEDQGCQYIEELPFIPLLIVHTPQDAHPSHR